MKRTTVVGYRSLLRRHLLPMLGSMKVTALDRQEVIRFHTKIGETPKATPKTDKRKRSKAPADQARAKASETTRGAANRARSLLSAILAAAEEWGLRPVGSNPCHGTPKFRERKIKRYLTPEERARLEAALCESARATKGQKAYVCRGSVDAVRLLSLTGARKSEITGLQWAMVDLDRAELRLPDSKTGEKVIPVSSNAVELLRQLEARRDPAVPWVCHGEQGKRLHNLPRAWESLRHHAGLDDLRLHDRANPRVYQPRGADVGRVSQGRAREHVRARDLPAACREHRRRCAIVRRRGAVLMSGDDEHALFRSLAWGPMHERGLRLGSAEWTAIVFRKRSGREDLDRADGRGGACSGSRDRQAQALRPTDRR